MSVSTRHIEPVLSLPPGAARWLVFGMGNTGLSCARFLTGQGYAVTIIDTRDVPPMLERVRHELPMAHAYCGPLDENLLTQVDALAVSPGVPLDHPLIETARKRGLPILGDIEIFARTTQTPYVAITGSNGKSTVTTLVAEMLAAAGIAVGAGANLGTPALDLLAGPTPDFFVLELSSFQLELTEHLAARVGCILNITPDHLDRHGTLAAYAEAKARILTHAQCLVLNADDPRTAKLGIADSRVRWFSLRTTGPDYYSILTRDGQRFLVHGEDVRFPSAKLRIKGAHNELNALAALASTDCLGISPAVQTQVLEHFSGLEHRCRLVGEYDGIRWFNDSKGTNVGASAAAIEGLFDGHRGVLIAGGQGKGADFRTLRAAVLGRVHTVVLIGEDAPLLDAALGDLTKVRHASGMQEAVEIARALANPGESVLLSPACASFDMFENYEARGRAFEAAVRGMYLI